MRFGVFLNQYSAPPHTVGAELVKQAQFLEDLGFDFVALGDRHLYSAGFVELLTALSWVAAKTQRIKVCAAGFILPLYHPVMLAETIASLNYLCNGRAIFGAVPGDWPPEYELFGIRFTERAGRVREGLDVIVRLLNGGPVTYNGKYYRLKDGYVSAPPAPRPEVWLGVRGLKSIERAARVADGWICSVREEIPDLQERLRLFKRTAGQRSVTAVVFRDGFVAESQTAARETIEGPLFNLYGEYAHTSSDPAEAAKLRQLNWANTSKRLLVGTPDEVVDRIRNYQRMGADAIMLRCQYPGVALDATMHCLHLFGKMVIPMFR